MGLLQHVRSQWSLISRSSKIVLASLFLVAVAVCIHPLWFYPHGLLTEGDWTPVVEPSAAMFIRSLVTWGDENLGQANIQLSFFPFLAVWGVMFVWDFPFSVVEKATFFAPIGLFLVLAPFFLSLRLHRRIDVALIVALFYSTTSFGLGAVPPIHFVYAFAPLLLLLLIYALEKNRIANWLLFAIAYSVAVSYEIRISYIVLMILIPYAIFLAPRPLREYVKPVSLLLLIGLALNAYWWVPMLFLRFQINTLFERILFGTSFFDVSHALTIVRYSWMPQGYSSGFFLIPVPWYLWVVPLVAFSPLLYRKQTYRRHVLFFSVAALIGIFLTKEIATPLPSVYQWLYDNFPGFGVFREASKFFLVTSLAYAALIGYALLMIREQVRGMFGRGVYRGLLLVFAGIACWHMANFFNPASFGNGEAKAMPEDYRIFNQYLTEHTNRQDRVLWVPRAPRWAISPRSDIVSLLESRWSFMASPDVSVSQRAIAFLQQPYIQEVIHESGIRYIGVPIHDRENNDDFMSHYENRQLFLDALDALPFLRRLDLPTQELVVYENVQVPSDYVSTKDTMFRFLSTDNLSAKYESLNNAREPFTFYVSDVAQPAARLVVGLFEKFQFDTDVLSSYLPAQMSDSFVTSPIASSRLRIQSDAEGAFSVVQEPVEYLHVSGEESSGALARNTLVQSSDLPDGRYYLDVAGSLQPLGGAAADTVLDAADMPVALIAASDENLIHNPSFEDGLWEETVGDCHNYDDNPVIGMSLADADVADGSHALQLWAERHIACTSQAGIPVVAGRQYVLQFDYRGEGADRAAYYLAFAGASAPGDTMKYFLSVSDTSWHRYAAIITPPEGTTAMAISLYAHPPAAGGVSVNYYDNLSLREITKKEDIASGLSPLDAIDRRFEKGKDLSFSLHDEGVLSENLIHNPSFEDGLWEETVGDCHNYDDNPVIGMSLSPHARDGEYSLELWAERHIACTGQSNISIQPGREYMLRFDYQGDNTAQAGYYVGFQNGHVLQQRVVIPDNDWHTYTTRFVAPSGAEKLSLILYSYGSNTASKAMNRYDNVELRLLPPYHDTYNLISDAHMELRHPRTLTFERHTNTRVAIDVRGASQPFWLTLREGYDPGWRLNPARHAADGAWSALLPVSRAPFVSDDQHIALNGYLNGWYVDVPTICAQPDSCRLNADGTYDMDMTVEYWPQRWLTLGVLVSGCALCISLAWLMLAWRARRRNI